MCSSDGEGTAMPLEFVLTSVLLPLISVGVFALGLSWGWKLAPKGTDRPAREPAPTPQAPVASIPTPTPAPTPLPVPAPVPAAAPQVAVAAVPVEPATDTKAAAEKATQWYDDLKGVATGVAANIDAHNKMVESINAELSPSSSVLSQEAIVAIVAKMAAANEKLQAQLNDATHTIESQTKQIEVQLVEARTDVLTQCNNRRALDIEIDRRLAAWQKNRAPLAVAILDVDHFKKFNDTYGHQAGDDVLRSVGGMLKKSTRDKDFVARYGGEEFVVLFNDSQVRDAEFGAERSRSAIEKMSVDTQGQSLSVTASFGLVMPQAGDDAASILRRADEALYASKKAGRNCIHLHNGNLCVKVETAAPQPTEPLGAPAPPPAAGAEANTDSVTGLPNRAAFRALLDKRIASSNGKATTVMMVEVNHVENISGKYGDNAVSVVLRATAQLLGAAVRRADTVARYSGNSFAVMLPSATMAQVAAVAERIRAAVELCDSLKIGGKAVSFTVSVGLTETQEADDAGALLRRVMAAVIRSTDDGGNRVSCVPQLATAKKSPTSSATAV
jgi:diguanylate cyclase